MLSFLSSLGQVQGPYQWISRAQMDQRNWSLTFTPTEDPTAWLGITPRPTPLRILLGPESPFDENFSNLDLSSEMDNGASSCSSSAGMTIGLDYSSVTGIGIAFGFVVIAAESVGGD